MQKAYKAILAVAGRILFIGFSIQIVLGICWLVCNFTGFQKFGETALYEEISKTLICDEYEGILYSVLIMIAKGIEELILIPYRYIIYLLQLGFAFFASFKLLQSVGIEGKFRQIWSGLAMLTFPMAMQCHLAVIPDSLVCSFLLLEIAFGIKVLLGGEQLYAREYVKVLICWMLVSLVRPEYLYIGAVPVLFLFLYGLVKAWKSEKKRILYNGILVVAFMGMIFGVESLVRVDGYYGRVNQSLSAAMLNRTVWPHAGEDYEYWPEEVKETVTREQAILADYYADNVERILSKPLEDAVGIERAEELYREITEFAWWRHKGDIIHETAWDIVGYTFSPMVMQRQFTGKAYDSYSGRNYDIMRNDTPILTKYYVDYACWWFAAGLVIGAISLILCLVSSLIEKWRRKNPSELAEKASGEKSLAGKVLAVFTCLCTCGLLVLLYSMRGAGMMDYKKSIAVILLWILGMLIAQNKMFHEESKEYEGNKETL